MKFSVGFRLNGCLHQNQQKVSNEGKLNTKYNKQTRKKERGKVHRNMLSRINEFIDNFPLSYVYSV